jgi:hypothetical protein
VKFKVGDEVKFRKDANIYKGIGYENWKHEKLIVTAISNSGYLYNVYRASDPEKLVYIFQEKELELYNSFKVGDAVKLIDETKWEGRWAGKLIVAESIYHDDYAVRVRNQKGHMGLIDKTMLEPYVEKAGQFRIFHTTKDLSETYNNLETFSDQTFPTHAAAAAFFEKHKNAAKRVVVIAEVKQVITKKKKITEKVIQHVEEVWE